MYKKETEKTVKIGELRADIPEITERESILRNASEFEDGYILTSKVAGV